MLKLHNVTLVCVEDTDQEQLHLLQEIIQGVTQWIDFYDIKVFSSHDHSIVTNKIKPIENLGDYSVFILNDLVKYIESDYLMIIQTDGYPLASEGWRNSFLNYDYIGAPWTRVVSQTGIHSVIVSGDKSALHAPAGCSVGNGGFSLRSRKLMEEVAKANYRYTPLDWVKAEIKDWKFAEDEYICKYMNAELRSKGYTFAPVEEAQNFSAENDIWVGQFGFHGKETLALNQKLGTFRFHRHPYETI